MEIIETRKLLKVVIDNNGGKIPLIIKIKNNENDEQLFERVKNEVTKTIKSDSFFLFDSNLDQVNVFNIKEQTEIHAVVKENTTGFETEGYFSANPSTDLRNIEAKLQHTWKTAVCELVDNSIQYTLPVLEYNTTNRRKVDIIIDNDKKICCINDNGIGVPPANMNAFVKLAERQYHEIVSNNLSYVSKTKEKNVLLYNNDSTSVLLAIIRDTCEKLEDLFSSQLSKWGVGSKYALARIGEIVTIYSQENSSAIRSEITIDNKDQEFKFKKINKFVPLVDHFTHIKVSNIDNNSFLDSNFQVDESKIKLFENSLAHTYYFYIFGFGKFFLRVIQLLESRLKFSSSFYDYIGLIEERDRRNSVLMTLNGVDLSTIPTSIDSYLAKAQDVFIFSLSFCTEKDKYNTVEEYGASHYSKCHVLGVIFYFPYDKAETKPKPIPEFEQSNESNDEDSLVEYYWVGRLLPKITSTTSSARIPKFMHVSNRRSQKIPKQCFNRVKGYFFLNRAFTPNQNKTDLVQDENSLIHQELFHQFQDPGLTENYTRWLSRCHQTKDIEYIFHDTFNRQAISGNQWRHYFSTLEIPLPPNSRKTTIKVGNYISLINISNSKEIHYGEVSKFSFESSSDSHDKQKNIKNPSIWLHVYRYGCKCSEHCFNIDGYTPALIEESKFFKSQKLSAKLMLSVECLTKNTKSEKNTIFLPRDEPEISFGVSIFNHSKKALSAAEAKLFQIKIFNQQELIAKQTSYTNRKFVITIPTDRLTLENLNNLTLKAILLDSKDENLSPIEASKISIRVLQGEVDNIELTTLSKLIRLESIVKFDIKFKDKRSYINIPPVIVNKSKDETTPLKLTIISKNEDKFWKEYLTVNVVTDMEDFSYIHYEASFFLNEDQKLKPSTGEEVSFVCSLRLEDSEIRSNILKLIILPGEFHRSVLSIPSKSLVNQTLYNISPILYDQWENPLNLNSDYNVVYNEEELPLEEKLDFFVSSDYFISVPRKPSDKQESVWIGNPIIVNYDDKTYYTSCSVNGIVYRVGDYFMFKSKEQAQKSKSDLRWSYGYLETLYEQAGQKMISGRWVFDPKEYKDLSYSHYFTNIPSDWKGEFPELNRELILSDYHFFGYSADKLGKKCYALSMSAYNSQKELYIRNPNIYQVIRFFCYDEERIIFLKEDRKRLVKVVEIECQILVPTINGTIKFNLQFNSENRIWMNKLVKDYNLITFDEYQLSFIHDQKQLDRNATPKESGLYPNCFIIVMPIRASIDQYNYTITADLVFSSKIENYRKLNKVTTKGFSIEMQRNSNPRRKISLPAYLPTSEKFVYTMEQRVKLAPSNQPRVMKVDIIPSSNSKSKKNVPLLSNGVLRGDYESEFAMKISILNDFHVPNKHLKGTIRVVFNKKITYDVPIFKGVAIFDPVKIEKHYTTCTLEYKSQTFTESSSQIELAETLSQDQIQKRDKMEIENADSNIDYENLNIPEYNIQIEKVLGPPTKLDLTELETTVGGKRDCKPENGEYCLLLDAKYTAYFELRDKQGNGYNESDSKKFTIVNHTIQVRKKTESQKKSNNNNNIKIEVTSDAPKLKSGTVTLSKFLVYGTIEAKTQYCAVISLTIEIYENNSTTVKCEIPMTFLPRGPADINCKLYREKTIIKHNQEISIPHLETFPGIFAELIDKYSNRICNQKIELLAQLLDENGKKLTSLKSKAIDYDQIEDEDENNYYTINSGKYIVLKDYKFEYPLGSIIDVEVTPRADSTSAKLYLHEKAENFPILFRFRITPSSKVPKSIVVEYNRSSNLPTQLKAGSEFAFETKILAEDGKTDLSSQFSTTFELFSGSRVTLRDNKFTKAGVYQIKFICDQQLSIPPFTHEIEIVPSLPKYLISQPRLPSVISPFKNELFQNVKFIVEDAYKNVVRCNAKLSLTILYTDNSVFYQNDNLKIGVSITSPNPKNACRLVVEVIPPMPSVENIDHLFSIQVDEDEMISIYQQIEHLESKKSELIDELTTLQNTEKKIQNQLQSFAELEEEKSQYTPDMPHKKYYKPWQILTSIDDFQLHSSYILGSVGQIGSLDVQINRALTQWISNYIDHFVVDGYSNDFKIPFRKFELNINRAANWIQSKKSLFKKVNTIKIFTLTPMEALNDLLLSDDPQKSIIFPEIKFPGFVGYAVNLITLTQDHLQRDLRRRLWFRILGNTLVFRREDDLRSYLSNGSEPASNDILSLDGFFLRDNIREVFTNVPNLDIAFHGLSVEEKFEAKQIEKNNFERKLNYISSEITNVHSKLESQEQEIGELSSKLDEYRKSANGELHNNSKFVGQSNPQKRKKKPSPEQTRKKPKFD